MPRTKKPIDPALTGPVADFARELRVLRERAGNPPYDQMKVRGFVSKSNLSIADQGQKLPTRETLHGYVRGCGGSPEELDRLEARRAQIQAQLSGEPPSPAGRGRPRRGAVEKLPDPLIVDTLSDLIAHLRLVRDWAGRPTYKELERRATEAELYLPRSTASDMLNPNKERLPKLETMQAFLEVCGVPAEHRSALTYGHQRLADIQNRLRLAARLAKAKPNALESSTAPESAPVMLESAATMAAAADALARLTGESGTFRAMDETDAFVRDMGTADWQQIDPAYPKQWPADPTVHTTWPQRTGLASVRHPFAPYEFAHASAGSPDWSPEKTAAVDALNAEADRMLIEMGEERLLRPSVRRLVSVPRQRPAASVRSNATPRPRGRGMQYRPPVPPRVRSHRPRHLRGDHAADVERPHHEVAAATPKTVDQEGRQQALAAAEDPWDAWADPPGGGLAARNWEGGVAGKVFATIAVMLTLGVLTFFAADRSVQATAPPGAITTSGSSQPDPQGFAYLSVLWNELQRGLHGLSRSAGL